MHERGATNILLVPLPSDRLYRVLFTRVEVICASIVGVEFNSHAGC